MTPDHQPALGAPYPLPARPRTGNQRRGSGRRELSPGFRRITPASTTGELILPIAAVVMGLVLSAAWSAFLGFEVWRLVRLLWA
jgi:hypothetical protein